MFKSIRTNTKLLSSEMDRNDEPLVISDQLRVNGTLTVLTLSADGLLRWGHRSLSIAREVLGFTVDGPRIRIRAAVESGGGICCFSGKGVPVRKEFVFEPTTEDSKTLWCSKLRDFIDSLGRPKKLLVFLNPYGGKKYASKIFLNDVKPYLEDANVEITLQETKHQLHAKEVAQSMDISKFDGIVCVSGDGILVEVVNGLLEREDWASAIKMPLGLVPAGTGNGMVKSLLDSVGEPCTPANAILAIIQGHKRSLDVATIVQGQTKFFSVLMLAWGLVADIDIESEKYRWMGSARMDFYALQRIFHLREYTGSISFVPAPGYEAYGEPTSYKGEEQSANVGQRGYRGPNMNLENLEWRTIKGPFVSVWLHNVPWASEDTMAAPDAKFSDGCLDLIVIKDCPKLSLLALMTKMSDGGHVKSPYASYLKVKAFWLEPGPRVDEPSKEGIIDSDGEVLARGKGAYGCEQKAPFSYDKLQITVDQGVLTLFSPVQG